MLEVHLAEVKHKGEMKIQHPEHLAHGRLLHAMIHEKTGRPPHPHHHCLPASLPATCSKCAWETFTRSNRILSCWSHTWQKKKKKKKQNFETLNPQPVKSFSLPCYTEKTGGHWLQTCLGDTDKQDWMLKE
jgi:hypothetical protein